MATLKTLKASEATSTPVNMKTIKNYSLQGLHVLINTEEGPEFIWLQPKQVITVPEHQISEQAITLHQRRLIVISN